MIDVREPYATPILLYWSRPQKSPCDRRYIGVVFAPEGGRYS